MGRQSNKGRTVPAVRLPCCPACGRLLPGWAVGLAPVIAATAWGDGSVGMPCECGAMVMYDPRLGVVS